MIPSRIVFTAQFLHWRNHLHTWTACKSLVAGWSWHTKHRTRRWTLKLVSHTQVFVKIDSWLHSHFVPNRLQRGLGLVRGKVCTTFSSISLHHSVHQQTTLCWCPVLGVCYNALVVTEGEAEHHIPWWYPTMCTDFFNDSFQQIHFLINRIHVNY